MPRTKTQSVIQDLRDELFLDTAVGGNLNTVGSNLGVDRPAFAFNDDSWRYAVKEIALQPKNARNIFYRVLEVVLGPQKTRIANFDIAPLSTEVITQFADSSNLLQVGTLLLDPGLATEETITFCFRDLETNKVFLNSPLQFDHEVIAPGTSNLAENHPAASAILHVVNSSLLPIAVPFPIILDRGTENEELLVVTDNDTTFNQLTLLALTTKDHNGPKATFLRKPLERVAPGGRMFVVLDTGDTRNFPASGYIRINFNQPSEETIAFASNDIDNNSLILVAPLVYSHAAGESVELVTPGAAAEVCSAVQLGSAWTIQETQSNKVIITIPEGVFVDSALDVSFFHDALESAFSTTLAADLVEDDTEVSLTDSSGLSFSGIISVDGTHLFYTERDDDANTVTLSTPFVGTTIVSGSGVDAILHGHTVELEDGNTRDVAGVLRSERFSGPYVYNTTQYAPSTVVGSLDETLAGPTYVAVDQSASTTALEVLDASNHPVPPFTPYSIRVGQGSGDTEILTVTDRTLKNDASTTVSTLATAPVSVLSCADTTDFPESDGVHSAGYHIIVDRGGPHEEILTVDDTTPGTPGTFSLVSPTAITHAVSETVELVHDVLSVDPLTTGHSGPTINPSENGHLVEKLVENIPLGVGEGSQFPENGVIYLNFGKQRINVRQKLVSATATELTMHDSSVFPTTGFPYRIVVGQGLANEEIATVSVNNTGTNKLTVAAMVGTFVANNYVEFTSGTPTTVTYVEKDSDSLVLAEPTALESVYTEGEQVMLTNGFSVPNEDGSSYALKMPPDRSISIKILIDLVRAAGVEVEFIINQVTNA